MDRSKPSAPRDLVGFQVLQTGILCAGKTQVGQVGYQSQVQPSGGPPEMEPTRAALLFVYELFEMNPHFKKKNKH